MSFETLKQEIASLPNSGRNQLMGYLIELRARESDPYWAVRTAALLDDKTASRWVAWEEAKKIWMLKMKPHELPPLHRR